MMKRRSFLKLCGAAALAALAPITVVAQERQNLNDALLKFFREKIAQMEDEWNKAIDDKLLHGDGYIKIDCEGNSKHVSRDHIHNELADAGFNIVPNIRG